MLICTAFLCVEGVIPT